MESITVYPKNEKQKSLLKSLLEEMKVRFEIATSKDETILSEKVFLQKLTNQYLKLKMGKLKYYLKTSKKSFWGYELYDCYNP
jgi:hypothetical protein